MMAGNIIISHLDQSDRESDPSHLILSRTRIVFDVSYFAI